MNKNTRKTLQLDLVFKYNSSIRIHLNIQTGKSLVYTHIVQVFTCGKIHTAELQIFYTYQWYNHFHKKNAPAGIVAINTMLCAHELNFMNFGDNFQHLWYHTINAVNNEIRSCTMSAWIYKPGHVTTAYAESAGGATPYSLQQRPIKSRPPVTWQIKSWSEPSLLGEGGDVNMGDVFHCIKI